MIDTMNLLSIFEQPLLKILILGIIILILMFRFLNTNILLLFLFGSILILYHKEIFESFQKIDNSERIIKDNKKHRTKLEFDEKITKLILRFKKYRKYNKNAYDNGYNHLKLFLYYLREDSKHPRQYFENAEFHLKNSLNHFQSISISVPEPSDIGEKIGKLCKKLHKYCYHLLYNVSIRNNESWRNEPNIDKSEITMNVDNVQPIDEINYNLDLY